MSLKAIMVPIPAAVPLSPLTDATESLLYRSVGNTLAIVEKEAYENVATAKSKVMRYRFTVRMVGMSSITPTPQKTTKAFLAAPSRQPRRIKYPEAAPPKKFPRSAARKGTHTAIKPLFNEMPLATR